MVDLIAELSIDVVDLARVEEVPATCTGEPDRAGGRPVVPVADVWDGV